LHLFLREAERWGGERKKSVKFRGEVGGKAYIRFIGNTPRKKRGCKIGKRGACFGKDVGNREDIFLLEEKGD